MTVSKRLVICLQAVKEWFQKNNIAFYHVEWC